MTSSQPMSSSSRRRPRPVRGSPLPESSRCLSAFACGALDLARGPARVLQRSVPRKATAFVPLSWPWAVRRPHRSSRSARIGWLFHGSGDRHRDRPRLLPEALPSQLQSRPSYWVSCSWLSCFPLRPPLDAVKSTDGKRGAAITRAGTTARRRPGRRIVEART